MGGCSRLVHQCVGAWWSFPRTRCVRARVAVVPPGELGSLCAVRSSLLIASAPLGRGGTMCGFDRDWILSGGQWCGMGSFWPMVYRGGGQRLLSGFI